MSVNDDARLRVAHVVPALNIGGVETAIERSLSEMRVRFDYRVFTVRGRGVLSCDQRGVLTLLLHALRGSWRPQIVITSLWWAHPFGMLLSVCGVRWLAFFHSGSFAHSIDRRMLAWAWRNADERLVDSQATAEFMGASLRQSYDVVPCVFDAKHTQEHAGERDIDVIWVGRNSKEKRLDLVCDFVRALAARIPAGRFALVVAGSVPEFVSRLSAETGWDVDVFSSVSRDRVLALLSRSRFYLLVSDYEGMSMSTIEAVQAGCVAVVRPVGEIPRYLDAQSAIMIRDAAAQSIAHAAGRVVDSWHDRRAQRDLCERAQSQLKTIGRYVDALTTVILRAREAQ
jgi:glycosyltransferase involved in cell wall biosynthesis